MSPQGQPRLVYLVSHPIQYQAPLLQRLAERGRVDLRVLFLSDFSLGAYRDPGFGREVSWDVPLLEGYSSRVLGSALEVTSIAPNLRAIGQVLDEERPDVLWVHGWRQPTIRRALAHVRRRGVPALVRGESKPEARGLLRRAWLRRTFGRLSGCLAIGSENRRFYEELGVPDERLFWAPYSVDNAFFSERAAQAAGTRAALRVQLGLDERPVVLFAAKLIERKRPLDLVRAFQQLPAEQGRAPAQLVIVGEGPQRAEVEAQAGPDVRVLGFRNQSELPALYGLCDLFVLPSRYETWGLSLNEAMSASRPVLATEGVGSATDLVIEGETGHCVPVGDVAAMAAVLQDLLRDRARLARMGAAARRRVAAFDLDPCCDGLEAAVERVVAA